MYKINGPRRLNQQDFNDIKIARPVLKNEESPVNSIAAIAVTISEAAPSIISVMLVIFKYNGLYIVKHVPPKIPSFNTITHEK